ncbi:isomerase [Hyphodiscus hymeniophilus]|uniref:Isomerase n=1 Tax=Hyphodiscus hymeniophilus TaxID=353542 RepID=A0A9P6VQS4_9HELO|nr:isomerase [Hyphodiscus hymeniophilus]
MGTLQFVTLDVFTINAYEGNPLAVIKVPAALRSSLTKERKQLIAREFNLSETVFLHENRLTDAQNEWTIDIFTTQDELPFAGHPTIGSACYMLNGHEPGRQVSGTFITKAGRVPILREPSKIGNGLARVQADVPHNVHIHYHTLGDLRNPIPGLSNNPVLARAEMDAALVSIVKGMTFLLVQLDNLEMLAQVEVVGTELSFHGLLDHAKGWDLGFVAKYYYVIEDTLYVNGYGIGDDKVQRIRTRMIESTMEDPATGSAACALGSYLALRQNRTRKFEVTQGVEMGRKSVIGVEVVVDKEGRRVESVKLSGSAVLVMEGTLRI